MARVDLNCNGNNNRKPNLPPRMTVNYSKLFKDISSWGCFQLYTMVRLRKLPYSVHNNGNSTSNGIVTAEEAEQHTIDEQCSFYYTLTLQCALTELWLQYNFDSITSFCFDISEAQHYLPVSDKLARIQLIILSRRKDMPHDYLEHTILFIKHNQAAFPNRRTLDVQFASNWFIYDKNITTEGAITELDPYINMRNRYREQSSQYMKPALSIYKAVGKPSMITATKIPDFYEHAKDMELLGLKLFEDYDLDRAEYHEALKREEFLRRCENLRELQLGVDSHNIFSWAVEEAKDSILTSTGRSLRNLESLSLWTDRSYNSAIQAFNDALFAFSTTLRSISLSVDVTYSHELIPVAIRNTRTLEAILLLQRASATSIGDWTYVLPWLRSITVHLNGVSSIKVGSFSQCPNLESLDFRFGLVIKNHSNNRGRPEGIAPATMPTSGELIDPLWTQLEMDRTLFPMWNLPRLKFLHIGGMAAIRFDVRSLSSMQRLESFNLDVYRDTLFEQNMDEYISYQYCDSTEQPPTASYCKQRHADGIADPDRTGTMEQSRPYLHFFPIWNLPRLTYLKIYGMAAMKFDFRSLAGMQCLETLYLDTRQETFSQEETEEYIARQYGISRSQPHNGSSSKPGHTDGNFDSDLSKTWKLPKLKSLCLSGSPSSLFYLDLLRSFPKLKSLVLDGDNRDLEISRFSLFRSLCEVYQSHGQQDDINKETTSRDGDISKDIDDMPNLESQLERFTLYRSWTVSRQNITCLLTIYAPFLKKLILDRIGGADSPNVSDLFEALMDVDNINQGYEGSCTSNSSEPWILKRNPGRNLELISCGFTIGEEEQKKYGLRKITPQETRVFSHYGLRIYYLKYLTLGRQQDFDLVKEDIGKH
ncbi:hypothetical protein BGZ46_009461 [Entomortierella lignicola]|nr:hypothetical protein BGZ46_009461 [Entomortierella lignicola]